MRMVVCSVCSSEHAVEGGALVLHLQKHARQLTGNLPIPLGSKGRLHAIEWQVVGFARRRIDENSHIWQEYILWNPIHGLRWLSEDRGYWTLDTPMEAAPRLLRVDYTEAVVQGTKRSFYLLNRHYARATMVAGAWPILAGTADPTYHKDFIAPPHGLSEVRVVQDGVAKEIAWRQTQHLERNTVLEAFGLDTTRLPAPGPIGRVAPFSWKQAANAMLLVACIATALMLAVLYGAFQRQQDVSPRCWFGVEGRKDVLPVKGEMTVPLCTLHHAADVLRIEAAYAFPNDESLEFEAEGLLVNETTGQTYEIDFWSYRTYQEAGQSNCLYYKNMQPGTYSLVIDLSYSGDAPCQVFLHTIQSPPDWTTFWIVMVLIWGLYALVSLKETGNEAIRWTIGTASAAFPDEK